MILMSIPVTVDVWSQKNDHRSGIETWMINTKLKSNIVPTIPSPPDISFLGDLKRKLEQAVARRNYKFKGLFS